MGQIRAIDIRLLGKKRTGDETVFFNLTRELLALDQENEYLLLTDEQDETILAALRVRMGCVGQNNVQIISLRGKNRFVWNLVTLPWFLIRHAVDIYHTQYILPFFVPKRVRIVNHIHDISFKVYPELIGWKDRFFLALLIPRSLRRANRIIAPSQFTKNEIVRCYGIHPEKIVVVENALSEDFAIVAKEGDIEAVRKRYHLPERYILSVGTLQLRKNLPLLISAFALVRKRVPDVVLVLVGNRRGHHFDTRIDEVIKELSLQDAVIFPGYVEQSDLPVMLQGATLFAFPSLYEGFGIPLLEAMSQGTPVVASDIPCLREVAADAALYFDPRSIASCEEKLYTLLTDSEQRVRGVSKGKDRLSLFSWKKSALSLHHVYQGLR